MNNFFDYVRSCNFLNYLISTRQRAYCAMAEKNIFFDFGIDLKDFCPSGHSLRTKEAA